MNMAIVRATLVVLILMVIVQWTYRGRIRQEVPQKKCKRSSQGRTCRPECPACQAEGHESAPPPRPAVREKKKSGRPRSVDTNWHFCPNRCCSHYGWVGLGNIVANGHPNRSRWRQLHCTVCKAYFMETMGTIFYRSSLETETLCRIVQGLAEGWNLHSIARVFEVDPDTVKACLVRAAEHMDAVSKYLIHDLHLTQVQVDELWALVQSWANEDERGSTRKRRRLDGYGRGLIPPASCSWPQWWEGALCCTLRCSSTPSQQYWHSVWYRYS